MKRNGNDYGRWFWTIEDGKLEMWKNLSDRQLANLYNFFMSKIDPRLGFTFEKLHTYKGALGWIKQEADFRRITILLRYTEEYGSYPYLSDGRWMVFDRDTQKDVPLIDYDWSKIPPDAVEELRVMQMLGLVN